MKRFKYCHFITKLCKISGASQSRRTGTDHCNFMPVGLLCADRFDIMFQRIICNETLQLTDGDRLALDSADALPLTLGFLRAYTSANSRKRACLSDHFVGFLDISIFYFFDKSRNIDRNRTSLNTFRIFTIDASGCLFHRFFLIISKTNFFKVCCSYFRILFSYRHFL